jgi:hypothetical protein
MKKLISILLATACFLLTSTVSGQTPAPLQPTATPNSPPSTSPAKTDKATSIETGNRNKKAKKKKHKKKKARHTRTQ